VPRLSRAHGVIACALSAIATTAYAHQAAPTAPAPATATAAAAPAAVPTQVPAAPPASAVLPPVVAADTGTTVGLKSDLRLHVDRLTAWRLANAADAGKLVLYINGYPIQKLTPRHIERDEITFTLSRHGEDRQAWAALLGRPSLTPRQAVVQLGVGGRVPFDGAATIQLETLDAGYLAIAATAFVLLLAAFLVIAHRSDLLREGRMAVGAEHRRPFSLGRTQMAVWFFIVVASFVFIWIVTGAYDPLTGSVLALIGISASTALGGAIIDANKDAAADNTDGALKNERLRIETDLAALRTAIAEAQQRRAEAPAGVDLSQFDQRIAERQADVAARTVRLLQIQDQTDALARAVQPSTSEGFWTDLLSDQNGVSFHRFQIVVWTAVLSVIFIYTVYDSLAMPDFDAKLLGLMGISSGTYLGFKFPEAR